MEPEGRRAGPNLTITTATPLHYDAACGLPPASASTTASWRISGTFGETTGYVRIEWQRCGDDPDIGFVADE